MSILQIRKCYAMRKIRVGSRESKLAVIQSEIVIDMIKKNNPDVEVEVHYGGQPVYYYFISVE